MIINLKLGSNEAVDFLKNKRGNKSTLGTGVVYEVLQEEQQVNGGIIATCRVCEEEEEGTFWDNF